MMVVVGGGHGERVLRHCFWMGSASPGEVRVLKVCEEPLHGCVRSLRVCSKRRAPAPVMARGTFAMFQCECVCVRSIGGLIGGSDRELLYWPSGMRCHTPSRVRRVPSNPMCQQWHVCARVCVGYVRMRHQIPHQ